MEGRSSEVYIFQMVHWLLDLKQNHLVFLSSPVAHHDKVFRLDVVKNRLSDEQLACAHFQVREAAHVILVKSFADIAELLGPYFLHVGVQSLGVFINDVKLRDSLMKVLLVR